MDSAKATNVASVVSFEYQAVPVKVEWDKCPRMFGERCSQIFLTAWLRQKNDASTAARTARFASENPDSFRGHE